MKLLVHTNQLLYPADTGGKIRSARLLEGLAREHEVTVVCHRRSHDTDHQVAAMAACCHRIETVWFGEAALRSPAFYVELAANLASPAPFMVNKYRSAAMQRRIDELLAAERFDLLICDLLSNAINVLHNASVPRLLSLHNVEADLVRRLVATERRIAGKAYLWLDWLKMRRFERRAVAAFDRAVVVSRTDRDRIRRDYGAVPSVVPNGVDLQEFVPDPDAVEDPDRIVFVGSMDWPPNEDAIAFFAAEVMPRLRANRPRLELVVVGRNPTAAVRRLTSGRPGVTLTGTVPDVRPYIASAALVVVPLRSGSGTRIKILEAMAMGKPVVSTTIGAEGLDLRDGLDIRIADGAEAFARAVIELLDDPAARRRMGETARATASARFGWADAARRFTEVCREVVDRARCR